MDDARLLLELCPDLVNKIRRLIQQDGPTGGGPGGPRRALRLEARFDDGALETHNGRISHQFSEPILLATVDAARWTAAIQNAPSPLTPPAETMRLSNITRPRSNISDEVSHVSSHTASNSTKRTRQDEATTSSSCAPNTANKRGRIVPDASSSSNIRSGEKRTTKAVPSLSRDDSSSADTTRQITTDPRSFPQRKKHRDYESHIMQPSSLDKLVTGIWEQLHGNTKLSLPDLPLDPLINQAKSLRHAEPAVQDCFRQVNMLCRQVSLNSRCSRSLEVIVQTYWMECYNARISAVSTERRDLSLQGAKRLVLMEACQDFSWTEKELRNKMAIWRGYKEIKDAAGWAGLVFAGAGLYRFCKFRVGFDSESKTSLERLAPRFEVAADTLHPNWRSLLSIIGAPTNRYYHGHPHDWVVSLNGSIPVPLRMTYRQWDPDFQYTHIEESEIDVNAWGDIDPRRNEESDVYYCKFCEKKQSDDPKENECSCFPDLYGNQRSAPALQVFSTVNGRNNGVIACCASDRGIAIGEFIGVITRGLSNTDVLQAETKRTSSVSASNLSSPTTTTSGTTPISPTPPAPATTTRTYQIHQARRGNHTRFVNHSCHPNSQFQNFSWLGLDRVVLVSKGRIEAGTEVTVDYSSEYWRNLEKDCLCGESACRFRGR